MDSKTPVRPDSDQNFCQSATKVFEIDLLLDKILEYTIHDSNGLPPADTTNVYRTCRLVNKAWLNSISRILLKYDKPLFKIYLHDNNSTAGTPHVAENGKLLDHFLKSVSEPLCLGERVPPHFLKVSPGFYVDNDHQKLLECLSNCGSGLLALHLGLPKGINLQAPPTNASFPKLGFFFVDNWHTVLEEKDKMNFIQWVLDASQQLISFKLRCPKQTYGTIQTFNLRELVLPSSITNVTLESSLEDAHLQLLVANTLPNLATLKLQGVQKKPTGGLISSILRNVRKTIVTFHLEGLRNGMMYQPEVGYFQLPRMEKLKSFKMRFVSLELEEGHSSLHQLVPVLTHVFLNNQTPARMSKWMDNSCFETVTSLTVGLEYSEMRAWSWDALPMAYPNLDKLDITIDKRADVEMIWRDMRRLRFLRIRTESVPGGWDSLLIGCSEESLGMLRESPDLWQEIQRTSTCSIRNLSDLQTLYLISFPESTAHRLISEAAFNFAFLKMPKLTKLVLEGGFFLAPLQGRKEITEKWEQEGRSIEMYQY